MHQDGSLDGLVVLVTGASSGLGEQLARALVARGARPVLAARRAERLRALEAELDGAVDTVACDVTDDRDRRRLIETVASRHGRIDGLVQQCRPRRRRSCAADERRDVLSGPRRQLGGALRPFLPRRRAYARGWRPLDRERGVGDGAAFHRADRGRRICRLEVGLDRPHARARLAVGALRDSRQRGRSWILRVQMTAGLGDDAESFPDWLTEQIPLGRGGRRGELDQSIPTYSAQAAAS